MLGALNFRDILRGKTDVEAHDTSRLWRPSILSSSTRRYTSSVSNSAWSRDVRAVSLLFTPDQRWLMDYACADVGRAGRPHYGLEGDTHRSKLGGYCKSFQLPLTSEIMLT